MLIELEEPFKSMYKAGYVSTRSDGRQRIVFSDESGRVITGMSYARYLMSVKLGHIVPDDLEVDHRDEDKTNDSLDNLQLLTGDDNKLKQQYHYVMNIQQCFGYECAYCETRFILTERDVKERIAAGTVLAFCSRSCSSSYHYQVSGRTSVGMTLNTLTDEDKANIKALRSQGLSSRKIAEITGFDRNTVMKYW